jgi:hypothetical protein
VSEPQLSGLAWCSPEGYRPKVAAEEVAVVFSVMIGIPSVSESRVVGLP